MLERYEPTTKMSFVRNPNYFQSGLPYVDAVELTVDPDPASAFAAFVAGKYDFGPESGMAVRRSDLSVAKKKIRWYLQTRELLLYFGRLTAVKRAQDPFTDVRGGPATAM